MDQNHTDVDKVERKIYSKEVLSALRCSELSNQWPKCLDKTCINSHGQWDPVKSFDTARPEIRRNSFYENKTLKTIDKNKDDISLRPERRKWNDGCQVSMGNKRGNVGDESHSGNNLSYRKSSYNQSATTPNCGGGDHDKRPFLSRSISSRTIRESRENCSANKYGKGEKAESKNNSNLDEQNKEEPMINEFTVRKRFNTEPEWFSNGPENCDDTIELGGITEKDSLRCKLKEVAPLEKIDIDFKSEAMVFADESIIVSPKREGSRFQEIFQKETSNLQNLKETREVEDLLKAVLSDKSGRIDVGRLNNSSKPLPNGVLTVEEIEKNLTSSVAPTLDFQRLSSKNATIDTLTSFEPSLTSSLLSSGDISNEIVDNSKVVNWLFNLNLSTKEPPESLEYSKQSFYQDGHNFAPMGNAMTSQSMFGPPGYSKFGPHLQRPPGLPLMMNTNQMLQQQQHLPYQQTQSMNPSFHNQKQLAFMKQMSAGPPNNVNFPTRNLIGMQQQEVCMPEKYSLNSQHSVPNDLHLDSTVLSSMFSHNSNMHMNHVNSADTRNSGPPGLSSLLNLADHKTNSNSRPIVKTSQQYVDIAHLNDFSDPHSQQQQQQQQQFRRVVGNHDNHSYLQEMMNKPPTAQYNHMDMFQNMRNCDAMVTNQIHSQPPPPPSLGSMAYENVMQRSSSNSMLANLFNASSSYLPPLPQQAKYADQIETENI